MRRTSSAQLRQPVDVERELLAVDRDDESEPDADLRRGDRHHGQAEDLPGAVREMPREGDEREVPAVQHQLEREQDDERVAADEHAERADPEKDRRDREIPRGAWTAHDSTVAVSTRRVWAPRITPPTAAMSSTIEVISNARRWSTRK